MAKILIVLTVVIGDGANADAEATKASDTAAVNFMMKVVISEKLI